MTQVPEKHVNITRQILLDGQSLGKVAESLGLAKSRISVILHQTCRRVSPGAYRELAENSGKDTPPLEALREHKGLFVDKSAVREEETKPPVSVSAASATVLAERREVHVGTADFRANLREWLTLAKTGQGRVVVQQWGRPVMALVPLDEVDRAYLVSAERIVSNALRTRIRAVSERVVQDETLLVCHYDDPIAGLVPVRS